MKYFFHPASPNCRKVTALLRHLDLGAENKVVDLPGGEHLTPEFLSVNPNGRVPALVDGDLTVWESNAIIIYLAEKAGSDLWPDDARRLEIMRWLFWEQAHLMYATGIVFFQKLIKAMAGLGEPDQTRIDEAVVRQELEAAGFALDGTADFLRNPDDPRDEPFFKRDEPTDAFVHRWVKPGGAEG